MIRVGLSVAATIAWLCGQEENIVGIVGYYGSRICEYVERIPKAVCMLLYPHVEKSFAVVAPVDKRKAK